jgi:hypothetical protein
MIARYIVNLRNFSVIRLADSTDRQIAHRLITNACIRRDSPGESNPIQETLSTFMA